MEKSKYLYIKMPYKQIKFTLKANADLHINKKEKSESTYTD